MKVGSKTYYALDDDDLARLQAQLGNRRMTVNYFKGLSEMDPIDLADTTMDPERRVLRQVSMEDAAEADRLGLATAVVPTAELDDAVRDLVAAILAGQRNAVIEIKALLAGAAGRSMADQLRAEREAQTRRLRDLAGLGE